MDTVYENVTVVEFRTKLTVRELEPNLHAFTRSYTSKDRKVEGNLKLKRPVPAPMPSKGFLDDANLKLMLAGKAFTRLDLHIIPAEGREAFRTMGYVTALDHIDKTMKGVFSDHDPFEAFNAGAELADLVQLDTGGHMMFDRHGNALPVAIDFYYLNGHVDNSRYDVPKLAELMLARDDVCVFAKSKKSWKDEPDLKRLATTVEEAVMPVPYYNNDEGCRETMYFRWMPTEKESSHVGVLRRQERQVPEHNDARGHLRLGFVGDACSIQG